MVSFLYRIVRKVCYLWRRFSLPYRTRGELKNILANSPEPTLRHLALKYLGAQIADSAYLNPGMRVVFDHPEKAKIVIGERVAIAPEPLFVCDSGPGDLLPDLCPLVRQRFMKNESIVIGDDCWIGARVTILPGVTLGRGVVIGANSLVMHDCPPFTVWAGSPARLLHKMTVVEHVK